MVVLKLAESESESESKFRRISISPPACLLFSPAWPNSGRPVCPPAFSEGESCVSGAGGGDQSTVVNSTSN